MSLFGTLRMAMFGRLPQEAASFKQSDAPAARHLGAIFFTVIRAYHATLRNERLSALIPLLNAVEPDLRGFAYEGAALGLTQLDQVLPWRTRLPAFLSGPASPYLYPAYVGIGVALARTGKDPQQMLKSVDPVLGWLVVDGYGWRYGIFSRQFAVVEQQIPGLLKGYARRVYDQGLGRSMWFSGGAQAGAIAAMMDRFAPDRQPDLWSGIGFGCAYAGGASRAELLRLRDVAGPHVPSVAMGAAIAAKGRERAGNCAEHTDLACEIWCGLSAHAAAHITDRALHALPSDDTLPAFAHWRQRIAAEFGSAHAVPAPELALLVP